MPPNRLIASWLFTGAVLVFIMVIIGGITRLTGSGLSITEWKLISGVLPPLNSREWNDAFNAYQQFPQFQKVNSDITLTEFKSIFWWEYIHRLWGRMIGLFFIIPFAWFLLKGHLKGKLLNQTILLGLIGGFQGLLGWYMVKSGLVDNPYVSHYRLTAHLLTAAAAMGYSLWLSMNLILRPEPVYHPLLKRLSVLILSLITLQLIYGGFMAGTRAGLFFPTFPDMNGEMIPPYLFSLSPWWKNFTDNITAIHFFHRLLGYLIAAAVFAAWIISRRPATSAARRKAVASLGFLVIIQLTLGIITVLNSRGSVPVIPAVMHQAAAFLLLASSLMVLHRLRSPGQAD